MKDAILIRRVIAYVIDSLFAFLVFVILTQTFVFMPTRHLIIGSENWFRSGWNTEVYTLITMSLPTWLYFSLFEISAWQATIGKHLLKLQTVDVTTENRISLGQTITRTVIKLLPWEIAHFTNNIPTPMWYDPNPAFRFGFVIVPFLVTLYIVLASVTQKRQSLHDLIARTMVISNA